MSENEICHIDLITLKHFGVVRYVIRFTTEECGWFMYECSHDGTFHDGMHTLEGAQDKCEKHAASQYKILFAREAWVYAKQTPPGLDELKIELPEDPALKPGAQQAYYARIWLDVIRTNGGFEVWEQNRPPLRAV